MFVRRKQNKTGTTTIQMIDKSHKSYRVVKSLGVGHSKVLKNLILNMDKDQRELYEIVMKTDIL